MSKYPAYKGPLVLPDITVGKPLQFPDMSSGASKGSSKKSSADSEPKIDALTGDGQYFVYRTQQIQDEMSSIIQNYGIGNISYAEKYDPNYQKLKNELNYISSPAYFNELKRRKEERTNFLSLVTGKGEGENKGGEVDLDYWMQTGQVRTFDYVLNQMENGSDFDYAGFNQAQDLTTYGEALNLIVKEFNDLKGSTGDGDTRIKERIKSDIVNGQRESVYHEYGGASWTSNEEQLKTKAAQQKRQASNPIRRGLIRGFLETRAYHELADKYKGEEPIFYSEEFKKAFDQYLNQAVDEALYESIKTTYTPGVNFKTYSYKNLSTDYAKKRGAVDAMTGLFTGDFAAINVNAITGLTKEEKDTGYLDGPSVKYTLQVGEWFGKTKEEFFDERRKQGVSEAEIMRQWSENPMLGFTDPDTGKKVDIPSFLTPDKNGNITWSVPRDPIQLATGAEGYYIRPEVQRLPPQTTVDAFGHINEDIQKSINDGVNVTMADLGGTSYYWDPVSGNYFTGGTFEKDYIYVVNIGGKGGYRGDNIKPNGKYNPATGNTTYETVHHRTNKDKAYFAELQDQLMAQGRVKEAYEVGNLAITASVTMNMPADKFARWGEETDILGVTDFGYDTKSKAKAEAELKRLGYEKITESQSKFFIAKYRKGDQSLTYEEAVIQVLSNKEVNTNYGGYVSWVQKKKAGVTKNYVAGLVAPAGYTEISDGGTRRHYIANELLPSATLIPANEKKGTDAMYQFSVQRDMNDWILQESDVEQNLLKKWQEINAVKNSSTGTGIDYGTVNGY